MKSLLQIVTDILEAGEIQVSAIETWPENEDRSVSISLTVRPEKYQEEKRWEEKRWKEKIEADYFFQENIISADNGFEFFEDVWNRYNIFTGGDNQLTKFSLGRALKKSFPAVEIRYEKTEAGGPVTVLYKIKMRPMVDISGGTVDAPEATIDGEPAEEGGCAVCCPGSGPPCDVCPISPQNSTPIKLYDPEEAIQAMLAGKLLKAGRKWEAFWDSIKKEFVARHIEFRNQYKPLDDFSGLYSEGAE
jgi:hypothetical protein